jgi:predicted RNA methylase
MPDFYIPVLTNFLALKNLFIDELTQARDTLLSCGNDFALMKHAVDVLYRLFSQITGVSIQHLNRDKDILLPSGKAISTAAAAHCLLEMKRTAVFLRGINDAIVQALEKNESKPIRILYAGTGPYGTLLLPLLTLYKPAQLVVDWLDINPQSLTALQKIIDAFNLHAYAGEVYCADATTFTVSKPYDIVISETMLACLKNEPQVAIMQNLIPQLQLDVIFIPEEISIDAALTNPKMEQDRLLYFEGERPPFHRIELGNIFTVNRCNLETIRMQRTVIIPDKTEEFPVLKVFTTVKVFGNEFLSENDSSITLPKQFYDFRREKGREVYFKYVQGEKPHIESSLHTHTAKNFTI